MTDQSGLNPCYGRPVYRIVWGVSGLLLACLGIYVVFFGVVAPLVRIGAGSIITLLGSNAVWSSFQSRPSWLSRIVLFT